MIISGFTQRRSNCPIDETTVPGQHNHCIKCHLVNCSKFADNVSTCAMVACELCGWRCHECKLSEHTVTCPEERVACLNKEYGCPHALKRSKMAAHLIVCPASIVFCAEEWSRWPMHAREQGVRMPLPQEKSCLDCGQLDVGLAMRDQRMLIDSLRAPRKLRHTLRNPLTQKYPAAPFPNWRTSFDSDPAVSEATSKTVSDDDSDAPWDLSKPHPGLTESIRNRLYRVTKETADSLVAALEMTTDVLSSQSRLLEISETDGAQDGEAETTNSNPDFPRTSLASNHSPMESSAYLPSSPAQLYFSESLVNKTLETNSGGNAEGNLKQVDVVEGDGPFSDHLARSSISSDRFSDSSVRLKSTLHDVGGTQLHKLMGFKPGEGKEDEIHLHKMLGVSINIECINKYVIKPSSMYTFICAQNFRRDEYPWHFKNVHLEIHTGFCGWLEQRCPLANLGCTFSFHRMEPTQPNTVIYHSWLQESFGLRSTVQPMCAPCDMNNAVSKPNSALDFDVSPAEQFSSGIQSPNHAAQGNISQENGWDQAEYLDISDRTMQAQPSISNLAQFDRDNLLMAESQLLSPSDINAEPTVCGDFNTVDKCISLGSQHYGKLEGDTSAVADSSIEPDAQRHSLSQERNVNCKTINFMRVQPTIYTASNWDSKVLFQYDLEEEGDDERKDFYHSLIDLPFEILRQIARHLDSFSLCNLSLTCHQLRDVCCSLLDDHGIVLLNWQKQRSESSGRVTWKVVSKRWMFSTSFEPIHSWRFITSRPTIGDHLKVCPFNKDTLRHTEPVKLLMSAPEQLCPKSGESSDNVHFNQQ